MWSSTCLPKQSTNFGIEPIIKLNNLFTTVASVPSKLVQKGNNPTHVEFKEQPKMEIHEPETQITINSMLISYYSQILLQI